ncbi:MAG TPA: glycosyltransferase, partial [Pseudomonadales bacterium]|nr:glycosyltransferase [Pseudomonadales bacterium]
IIPVYDGFEETKRCIQSVLDNKNSSLFNVLVIEDCSPNSDIKRYLRELSDQSLIELFVNGENLGFVGTVNRGMSLHLERDVLLLNSDTVVANDWLDRILAHADSHPDIATITPFSNNAEICSFPRYCQPNPLFGGMSVHEVDAVFASLPMRQIDVPTGVGFCMYIRRDALNEVGLFDQKTFGRGYGEENDFCMRAAALGWRNVTCSNVFVFHDGGVSFSTEKAERVEHAMTVLDKRYPSYHRMIQEHLKKDPERPFRVLAQLHIMQQSKRPKYLFVAHRLGGGVIKHLQELAEHVGKDADFLFLKPGEGTQVELGCHYGSYHWSLFFDLNNDYQKLLDLLCSLNIERVHLHHVMGVSDDVLSLLDELAVPYDVTLHDYYFVNANPTLTDRDGIFAESIETRDMLCADSYPIPYQITVVEWRAKYGELLSKADRVFSPTSRCKEVHLEYFPELSIDVAYHPEWEQSHPYAQPFIPTIASSDKLKVLVVGAMSREKGADVLERTATYRDPLNRLEYHLLGYAYRPLAPDVIQHGAYDDANLDNLITELKPHLIWFPAQWHETYSYTLSAALRSGLPILASDLGSFPERLQDRPLSFIKSWRTTPIEWNDTLLQIRDVLLSKQGQQDDMSGWNQMELDSSEFLYSRDYVVKNEELRQSDKLLPSIDRLAVWCYLPGTGRFMGISWREKILYVLSHLREMPGLRHLLRVVPFHWQRKIKRWFSHRPMHDVIIDQEAR